MACSLTGTHGVLLLARAGHSSAPTAEQWSWAGPVPQCCPRCLSDTDGPQQQGGLQPPQPPASLAPPTPVLSLDWTLAHAAFVQGPGGGWGQGRVRRGCGQLHGQQRCPTPSNRLPSSACCSSACCGEGSSAEAAAPPGLPHPFLTLPTRGQLSVHKWGPAGWGLECPDENRFLSGKSALQGPGKGQDLEHASPWELQGPCGQALQAGPGWCHPQRFGPGAQGGASWASAVTPGAQRLQLEGPVRKHHARVLAVTRSREDGGRSRRGPL